MANQTGAQKWAPISCSQSVQVPGEGQEVAVTFQAVLHTYPWPYTCVGVHTSVCCVCARVNVWAIADCIHVSPGMCVGT